MPATGGLVTVLLVAAVATTAGVAVMAAVTATAVLLAGRPDTLGLAPGWSPVTLSVGLTVAAGCAAVAARAALLRTGPGRTSWALLATGVATWVLGRSLWIIQAVLDGRPVERLAPVDTGLLLLATFTLAAMATHPTVLALQRRQRLRLALDAVAIATALLLLVWEMPVGIRLGASPPGAEQLVLALCPIVDVLVAALVATTVLCRSGCPVRGACWLRAGLLLLSGASMVTCYRLATGAGPLAAAADLMWTAGFAAVVVAALREPHAGADRGRADSPPHEALPYLLVTGVYLAVAWRWLAGQRIGPSQVGLLGLLGLLMYLRQYLLMHHNRQLLAQLDSGREQLRRSGMLDRLTGLPNRTGLSELLAPGADGQRPLVTVLCLRPNRPHLLDGLGHDDGDAAVLELTDRIARCLRPGDRLARIAESAFAVLVAGGTTTATDLARDVMLAVEAPILTPHRRLHLSLAAGVAGQDQPAGEEAGGDGVPDMVQEAMIALHTVSDVPGGIAVFTDQMLHDHAARLDLSQAVARSLRSSPATGIEVLFEPVVDLVSGRLTGVAARAEWHDGECTPLPAGQLVALAREAGLAARVDAAVLDTALAAFADWAEHWPDVCRQLWVTVCLETLAEPDLPQRLVLRLAAAGLPPSALVVDPLDDFDDAGGATGRMALARLRDAGIRVAASNALAIADRGYGPGAAEDGVDFLDISPVLVDRCVEDLRAQRLITTTVEFAATRGALAAARQVVTVDQHEELRALGCVLARGPLYGTPMSTAETAGLMAVAATGAWQSPVGREERSRRSSRAWQELRQVVSGLPIAAFACGSDGALVLAEGALLDRLAATGTTDLPLTSLFDAGNPPASDAAAGRGHPLDGPLRQALAGEPAVSTVAVGDQWLQVHLCPGRDTDGQVTGAVGVAIDVTHRITAEQALRDSEQRFRDVFAQAPVGMVIVTPDGHLVQVNPAFAGMLGYSPDELAGRAVDELWHEINQDDVWTPHLYRSGEPALNLRLERVYRHRDGSPVWGRVTVGPLAESSPGTVICIVEDLRDVKRLEVELRHAQKLEAVGMLAAGIAHEINTPIQFIGDNINFLADAFAQLTQVLTATHRLVPAVDGPQAEELAAVTDAADLPWLLEEVPSAARQSLEGVARVATIVAAMRNFGHPDARHPSPVDVNAAIRDTATIARNEHKYVADLVLDLGEVPPVLGFPSEFHQVVLNLIVNAAHAIGDAVPDGSRRGTITVRSRADTTHASVSVTDDGCGMTPEVRERIFDPFFTTKEVGRGTGQGMTIVHSVVVDKHHGTIDVQTAPGQGTTITVRLPLAGDPEAGPEEPPPTVDA